MTKNDKSALAERLRSFFGGRLYPILVAFVVLVGAIFGIEFYTMPVLAVIFITCALLTDTVRPLIVTFVTFLFQISLRHSPSEVVNNQYGDGDAGYYFVPWRFAIIVSVISLMVVACIVFFIKNKCYRRINLRRDGMLLSTVALCVCFFLGGAFSSSWADGVYMAALQTFVFLFVFVLFAYGFREGESREELAGYFSYVSAIAAGVIIIQLTVLFIRFPETVFVGGGINKTGIMLGFGVWTLVGIALAMLIPAIFYGALTSERYSFVYFAVATLTWIFALLSMSRNAQGFATLAYAASVLVGAFKSRSKLFYRVLSVVGVLGALGLTVLLYDEIPELLAAFLDDNGRKEHANIAIENYLSYPVFGVGFGGFESIISIPPKYAPMGPWAAMAHNTILELMSALGTVGLVAYLVHRAFSLVPVLKKPTLCKSMLFGSVLVILLSSMLDNFVFDFYPMMYSVIALAIIHKAEQ